MGTPSASNEVVSMLQNLRDSKWRNPAESLQYNVKMFQMESSVSSTSLLSKDSKCSESLMWMNVLTASFCSNCKYFNKNTRKPHQWLSQVTGLGKACLGISTVQPQSLGYCWGSPYFCKTMSEKKHSGTSSNDNSRSMNSENWKNRTTIKGNYQRGGGKKDLH
ncbi:hypothetical protein KIL84_023412 [Mauremys mutica]|uniref:Uncharacterized protein n=1 Tax=Mauremys mutica TaxID=74926 RepID=A0A9D4API8_9SAUR|nr:hypothetical protein KIL84_023412 [Mauremys mutica]